MTVMRNRELSATVGQIRDTNFLGAFLNDVVQTAEWDGREILAVRIAGPILNSAGYAHVALGFGKPGCNFRIIDRPILSEPIEIRSFEIDIPEARGRASPEVGFPAGRFATFPVPVRARSVGVGDVVLEQVPAFAEFGFLDGVGLLMSLIFEAQGVAVTAILQVVHLPVITIVLIGVGTRTGVQGADFKARFAENFHGGPAAGTGSNHDHVVKIVGQWENPR
jgi:hypothetical protein